MDHLSRSALNCFSGAPVDRLVLHRRDAAWFGERLLDPGTGVLVLWRSRHLFAPEAPARPVYASPASLDGLLDAAGSVVLLGEADGRVILGAELPAHEEEVPRRLAPLGEFRELRAMGPLLEPRDAGLLAFARAMTYWHRRHRYCGDCGGATVSAEAGYLRVCTRSACGQRHFPRTDPAMIVLVVSGDRCLLGRQAAWPERVYSTIAGFVEPGESVEEAVVREVREETGVRVRSVRYHSSQPWPFPASLMLGFTARAATRRIHRIDQELEDVRWFSRAEISRALRAGTLRLPSRISIAYHLVEDWFDGRGAGTLRSLLEAQ